MNNLNFSTINMDFLNNLDKTISVDQSGKNHYIRIVRWELEKIKLFISWIGDTEVYSVFPFITVTELLKDPYIRLSDHFLVTNKSNPELIANFLEEQWVNSYVKIEDNKDIILYFKIKKVNVNFVSF
jgi:hypothetical protein